MLLYSRRFTIWLISFLAVLIVYFVYNRLSRTPTIPTDITATSAGQLADVCDSNTSVGKIGDVGVGVIKNARYTTLNAQKQVERLGNRKALSEYLPPKLQLHDYGRAGKSRRGSRGR
jgi:hypothetical protein